MHLKTHANTLHNFILIPPTVILQAMGVAQPLGTPVTQQVSVPSPAAQEQADRRWDEGKVGGSFISAQLGQR